MELAHDLANSQELLERYPGIAGFHFLLPGTGLVFLDNDRQEAVPEDIVPLDLVKDRQSDPREGVLLLAALRLQCLRIERAMRTDAPPPDLELGYLLPAGDDTRWHVATFCQHPWVIQAVGRDLDEEYKAGTRDPFHTDPDSGMLEPRRSVVRGLDELMDHRGPFNFQPYFPVMVRVVPAPDATDPYEIRVVNLRWSPPHVAGEPARPDLAPVFEFLAHRLTERGTIDRKRRIENRFELVD